MSALGKLYHRIVVRHQIATFTGHSLKDVESILEVHYLNRDPGLAEDALKKLELQVARLAGFSNEHIDAENPDDKAADETVKGT